MTEWRDLSDGELRARLLQRGIDYEHVEALVSHRDDCPDCQQTINDLIDQR